MPKLVLETRGFTTVVNGIDFSTDGRGWPRRAPTRRCGSGTSRRAACTPRCGGSTASAASASARPSPSRPAGELVVGVRDFHPAGNIRVYKVSEPEEIAELLPGHPQGGVAELDLFRGRGVPGLGGLGSTEHHHLALGHAAAAPPPHHAASDPLRRLPREGTPGPGDDRRAGPRDLVRRPWQGRDGARAGAAPGAARGRRQAARPRRASPRA